MAGSVRDVGARVKKETILLAVEGSEEDRVALALGADFGGEIDETPAVRQEEWPPMRRVLAGRIELSDHHRAAPRSGDPVDGRVPTRKNDRVVPVPGSSAPSFRDFAQSDGRPARRVDLLHCSAGKESDETRV